jgi:mRNA-capping enzyme
MHRSRPEPPPGWTECDNYGGRLERLNIIPAKTFLGPAYDWAIPPERRHNLRACLSELGRKGMPVGLVLDLSNTTHRRYDGCDDDAAVSRCHIKCEGVGGPPEAAQLNEAVFRIFEFLEKHPRRFVLVHCTHGFNRTGYVIASALIRLANMPVEAALRSFASARPPGIYKDAYIDELFRVHHERRNLGACPRPVLPWWSAARMMPPHPSGKHPPKSPWSFYRGHPHPPVVPQQQRLLSWGGGGGGGQLSHDDIKAIGEKVCSAEADYVRAAIATCCTQSQDGNRTFSGPLPRALSVDNMDLLRASRYWVSWKADGTRYMLVTLKTGCYLMNRACEVVRVQMRFPSRNIATSSA